MKRTLIIIIALAATGLAANRLAIQSDLGKMQAKIDDMQQAMDNLGNLLGQNHADMHAVAQRMFDSGMEEQWYKCKQDRTVDNCLMPIRFTLAGSPRL